MLKVCTQGRHQRLEDVLLSHLGQETQRRSTHKFVGMVQVVSDHIANQNHFRQEVTVGPSLLNSFQIEIQKLLQLLVLPNEQSLSKKTKNGFQYGFSERLP
jgi:hypothetical protein